MGLGGRMMGEKTLIGAHPPSWTSQDHAEPRPRPTSSESGCRRCPPAAWPLLCSSTGPRSPLPWGRLLRRKGTQGPVKPQPPWTPSIALLLVITWSSGFTGLSQGECDQDTCQGQERPHLYNETPSHSRAMRDTHVLHTVGSLACFSPRGPQADLSSCSSLDVAGKRLLYPIPGWGKGALGPRNPAS